MATWKLIEDGQAYDTVEAETAAAALKIAKGNVDPQNYARDCDGERVSGTVWVDVTVYCDETGERADDTVEVNPREPRCSGGEHDWRAPHDIVGGVKENPGVWGHGGGVRIHEVCVHCGCERVTDTWAQRRDTGEQGLRSVEYHPGKYAESVRDAEDDAS